MRPTLPTSRARRATVALSLLVAALAAAPRPGAAQTVSLDYAPGCADAACNTLRFTLTNPGNSALFFNTLGFSTTNAAFAFAPADPGNPAVGSFGAVDAVGPFGGPTTIGAAGRSVFIDFLNDAGFAFQLDAGTSGYVEVAGPVAALPGSAFAFTAGFDGGGSASGSVRVVPSAAVVPEPATVRLVAGGLVGVASLARRRAA